MANPDQSTRTAEEQDLVERLKKGQQWAFEQLVTRYQTRLLKIAYSITFDHEDSLEVVQDVFVSVYKNIRTFRQDSSLETWLRKITINHCLNWKRKWKRRFKWHHTSLDLAPNLDFDSGDLKSDDPEMLVVSKQCETGLMVAIQKLPEKLRVVFLLNALEDLSYDEIAKILNIKKGTVCSRLHAAREKLNAAVGSDL